MSDARNDSASESRDSATCERLWWLERHGETMCCDLSDQGPDGVVVELTCNGKPYRTNRDNSREAALLRAANLKAAFQMAGWRR